MLKTFFKILDKSIVIVYNNQATVKTVCWHFRNWVEKVVDVLKKKQYFVFEICHDDVGQDTEIRRTISIEILKALWKCLGRCNCVSELAKVAFFNADVAKKNSFFLKGGFASTRGFPREFCGKGLISAFAPFLGSGRVYRRVDLAKNLLSKLTFIQMFIKISEMRKHLAYFYVCNKKTKSFDLAFCCFYLISDFLNIV